MFQFPTFAHLAVWLAFNQPGYPIRISRDQRLFAPPPSFSQLITSFFASESLGIHRLPFFYFFILTSQFSYTIIQSLHDTVGFFIFSSFYAFLKIRFKFHSYVQLIYLHTSFDIRNLFSVLSIMSKNSSFRFFVSAFFVVQENSSFINASGRLRNSWRITDSNRWPPACKAGALASWANPPSFEWIMNS